MKSTATFTVVVHFGSEWQSKTGKDRMAMMLQAYKLFTENLHKGNSVKWSTDVLIGK